MEKVCNLYVPAALGGCREGQCLSLPLPYDGKQHPSDESSELECSRSISSREKKLKLMAFRRGLRQPPVILTGREQSEIRGSPPGMQTHKSAHQLNARPKRVTNQSNHARELSAYVFRVSSKKSEQPASCTRDPKLTQGAKITWRQRLRDTTTKARR